jgi:hypothetical protein
LTEKEERNKMTGAPYCCDWAGLSNRFKNILGGSKSSAGGVGLLAISCKKREVRIGDVVKMNQESCVRTFFDVRPKKFNRIQFAMELGQKKEDMACICNNHLE